MTNAALAAGLLALAALPVSAQESASQPEFEAVSIKPFVPYRLPGSPGVTVMGGGPCKQVDPGRLSCRGTSIQGLVAAAYGVKSYCVFGPDWLDSEKFEIEATIPSGATGEQVSPMLQRLLVDRFHLSVHRETREMQGYVLVVAKGGPKLPVFHAPAGASQEPAYDPASPPTEDELRRMLKERTAAFKAGGKPAQYVQSSTSSSGLAHLTAFGYTMRWLAGWLSNQIGHDVVDQTGLKGQYEISLRYSSDEGGRRAIPVRIGPDGAAVPMTAAGRDGTVTRMEAERDAPPLFPALQSQLGLKLEPRKVPVETIVVDSCDRSPTPN